MSAPILTFEEVSFCYDATARPAVQGLSFNIRRGELVALLGSNGSGKSTVGLLAAGLLEPASGRIVRPNSSSAPVGMVFQNPADQLMRHSVESELAWGLENLGIPRPEMRQRVSDALERFGLKAWAAHPPEALSDGFKQLTVIAAQLIMQPELLILDEATAYLDPHWKRRIYQPVREFAAQAGVLWLGTDAGAAQGADRVLLLKEGSLIAEGEPAGVLTAANCEAAGVILPFHFPPYFAGGEEDIWRRLL